MKRKPTLLLSIGFACVALFGGSFFSAESFSAAKAEETIIEISNAASFVSTMKNPASYEKGTTIRLTSDIDFSGVDVSSIWVGENYQQPIFKGNFDGDGYRLSNIVFSSNNEYYGLFHQVQEGAIIKNLGFSGKLVFNLSKNNTVQYFAGVLLAQGDNVEISECFIDNAEILYGESLENNVKTLDFSTKGTMGILAGNLINSSKVSNCLIKSNLSIQSLLTTNSVFKLGGVVGSLNNSGIFNCVVKGALSYAASDVKVVFYIGGMAGEVVGQTSGNNNAKIINNVFDGTMTKSVVNETVSAKIGNIAGYISATSYPLRGNLEFDYWTGEGEAFGENANYQVLNSDKLKKVEVIGRQFFGDNTFWFPQSSGWNFETVWSINEGILLLQRFEIFDFSFADSLDINGLIKTAEFVGGVKNNGITSYKFGQPVVINIMFKEEIFGFYQLNSVLLESNVVDSSLYTNQANYTGDEKLNGYTITFLSSDMYDGKYSFSLKPISFQCEVLSSDFAQGGVKYISGASITDKLPMPLSFESNEQSVVAVGNGIYTFLKWQLFYFDFATNDFGTTAVEYFENETNPSLSIKFGTSPFNQQFKLVAMFSDVNAVTVKFSGLTSEGLKKVTFAGQEVNDSGVIVSSQSTRIELMIVIEKDYELNVDSFLAYVKQFYGSSDTNGIFIDKELNEEGETIYKFNLNIKSIFENASPENFSLPISVRAMNTTQGGNLLWLWITISVVAVAVGVGIFLIIFLRRRGKVKINKLKAKAKEESYKDYYL